jgi:hypothetical protein
LKVLASVKDTKAVFHLLLKFNHPVKDFYWEKSVDFKLYLRVFNFFRLARDLSDGDCIILGLL